MRGIKLGLAVSVLLGLVSGPSAMWYANRVSDQAEQRFRQEAAARQKAGCEVINRMRHVYVQEPPSTPTGRESAEAWNDLIAIQCPTTPR